MAPSMMPRLDFEAFFESGPCSATKEMELRGDVASINLCRSTNLRAMRSVIILKCPFLAKLWLLAALLESNLWTQNRLHGCRTTVLAHGKHLPRPSTKGLLTYYIYVYMLFIYIYMLNFQHQFLEHPTQILYNVSSISHDEIWNMPEPSSPVCFVPHLARGPTIPHAHGTGSTNSHCTLATSVRLVRQAKPETWYRKSLRKTGLIQHWHIHTLPRLISNDNTDKKRYHLYSSSVIIKDHQSVSWCKISSGEPEVQDTRYVIFSSMLVDIHCNITYIYSITTLTMTDSISIMFWCALKAY